MNWFCGIGDFCAGGTAEVGVSFGEESLQSDAAAQLAWQVSIPDICHQYHQYHQSSAGVAGFNLATGTLLKYILFSLYFNH